MAVPILSVSQFQHLVNETLAGTYPHIVVEGEVSGFKINKERFVFFDIKDNQASVGCFMMVYQLNTPLEDGMKIRVTAIPKLTNWGKFSLTVSAIELAGEGTLQRAFELLKSKLEAEGLFEPARKRQLPKYPKVIGLITSMESAAYSDFMKIINQRFNGLKIKVADIQVQGAKAPGQIIGALEYFNELAEPPDLLVLIRGGGSLEDLQAFNDEAVARAVAVSRTPVIVGVGHEKDLSLADLVADLRAATPTDAAKCAVPDKSELLRQLQQHSAFIERSLKVWLNQQSQQLNHSLNRLERFLEIPITKIENAKLRLDTNFTQLVYRYSDKLTSLERMMQSLDPRAVLKRGYSIARLNGKIIKSASQLSVGDELMLQLLKDRIRTEVKSVETK
jgi:exodeoxyribonuclease VII large subunit